MMLIKKIMGRFLKNLLVMGIQSMLKELGLAVSVQFLEDVLKLSYRIGTKSLKFFRWAIKKLDKKHNPLSWNFLMDLLGKEKLFDAM